MVSPPVEDQPPETRLTSEPSRRKWGIAQIGKTRFWILVFCVLCQGATLLITWTLWDVRAGSSVPNLPVFDWLPQLPFGILLIVSLLFVLVDPKRGLFIHLMILAIASLLDQMRLQPQFLANWMLMLACVYPEGLRIVRWFLATLWLWAGLHKLLSPMWFGMQSWTLVERTGLDGQTYYLIFAIFVVVGEIVVGLTAIFKPRWAALMCPLLHGGIILFLSPLGINWNQSVIPWNLGTGVVGAWVLWQARPVFPTARWEWVVFLVFLIAPLGFYFGILDHGYSHVLYSDNLPHGFVTTKDETKEIIAWGKLRVPFPNERRLLYQNFDLVAQPGDKLHLYDPRALLPEKFFLKNEFNQTLEISEDEFLGASEFAPAGNTYDEKQSVFHLGQGGAQLLKRTKDSEIYAIAFEPEQFHRGLLKHLSGLRNLQQIQLANCDVRNEDLQMLSGLKKLTGIGLNNTPITDEGLIHLQNLPILQRIDRNNTEITDAAIRQLFGNR